MLNDVYLIEEWLLESLVGLLQLGNVQFAVIGQGTIEQGSNADDDQSELHVSFLGFLKSSEKWVSEFLGCTAVRALFIAADLSITNWHSICRLWQVLDFHAVLEGN